MCQSKTFLITIIIIIIIIINLFFVKKKMYRVISDPSYVIV